MRKQEWEQTNIALMSATAAVFAEHDVRIAHVGRAHDVPDGLMKVAIIGFAGETMRGMLALTLPDRLLERMCPIAHAHSQDDWQCELANLLVARFKRALLRLGVTVHLSTPMLASGTNVSLDTCAVSAVTHRFETEQGDVVYVVLDAIAKPLARLSMVTPVLATSGEVLLF